MKKYISIFIVFLLGITTSINGQSQKTQRKWQEATTALNHTAFIINYKKYKEAIEYSIHQFHKNLDLVSEEEIAMIEKNYTIAQKDFNIILDSLKYDFTNPQRQKEMFNHPDAFTRKYQPALERARQAYQNNCQQHIDLLINSDSASLLASLMAVTDLVVEVFKLIRTSQKEFKGMSEVYFEQSFATPLRLKDWEDYKLGTMEK